MHAFTASPQSLLEAVDLLQERRVLIVGDVMLDVYLEGDAERISPEAPVPVVNIAGERHMLGGAANVARNIRALGGIPCLVGMCGQGRDGDAVMALLDEAGIEAHMVRSARRRTTVKTRVMARGQQMLRLDKEDCFPPSDKEEALLAEHLENALDRHKVLVISDYAKGLLTPTLRRRLAHKLEGTPLPICASPSSKITSLSAGSVAMPTDDAGKATAPLSVTLPRAADLPPVEILVDPKPGNQACYKNISLMTPNRKEAALLAGMELRSRSDIVEGGHRIMDQLDCRRLLITLGGEGMALFLEDGSVWNIPTATKAVFDVTGAGDSVIATVALARAAGIALAVGCALANYAAGVVLEHVGVAAVSTAQLRAMVMRGPVPEFIPWA